MRIGDMSPQPERTAPSAPISERPAQDSATPTAPSEADQVQLSRLSQVIANAGAGEGRIEALRRAVENGSYQVPAAELAKKIVDFHTE